jgi:DsbC/DsbD-like thiol-disulfide interchange protein
MKTLPLPSAACLMLALLPSLQAHAADWIETDGAAMRIVAGAVQADGSLGGFLEISLEPGWKTYWRNPGDGGIPPSLLFSASQKPVRLLFPAPEDIIDDSSHSFGYHSAVALPFTLNAEDAAALPASLTAFVGICSEICVPFEATFDLQAEPRLQKRVEQAFARLPAAANAERGVSRVERTPEGLHFHIVGGAAKTLFVAPESGLALGAPIEAEGGFLVPVIRDNGKARLIDYTLVLADGPVSGSLNLGD